MFSLGRTAVRHSIRGRLRRHVMPMNQSREPNSRGSATSNMNKTFKMTSN